MRIQASSQLGSWLRCIRGILETQLEHRYVEFDVRLKSLESRKYCNNLLLNRIRSNRVAIPK